LAASMPRRERVQRAHRLQKLYIVLFNSVQVVCANVILRAERHDQLQPESGGLEQSDAADADAI